jgi:hypothetical protein
VSLLFIISLIYLVVTWRRIFGPTKGNKHGRNIKSLVWQEILIQPNVSDFFMIQPNVSVA